MFGCQWEPKSDVHGFNDAHAEGGIIKDTKVLGLELLGGDDCGFVSAFANNLR